MIVVQVHCFGNYDTIQHFISKEKLFARAPKLWHRYVTRLIFEAMNNITSKILFLSALQHQLKYYKQFEEKHKNTCSCFPVFLSGIIDLTRTSDLPFTKEVTRPFGFIQSKRASHIIEGKQRKTVEVGTFTVRLRWEIHLLKMLSLKMHFQVLIVDSYDQNNCVQEGLEVRGRKHQSLLFCGAHSSFDLYPPGQDVVAEMYFRHPVQYNFHLLHSITDSCLVSKQKLLKTFKFPTKMSISSTGTFGALYHFDIVADKLYVIHIFLSGGKPDNCTCMLFDGPGALSRQLKKIGNIFRTTSFRCFTAIVLKKLAEFTLNISQHLPSSQHQTFLLSANISHINIPDNLLKCGRWSHLFSTGATQSINLTVVNLTYNGNDTFTCTSGGIAAFDDKNGEFTEQFTLCESETTSGTQGFGRNLISNNSTLLLLAYSFSGYSEVNFDFVISSTPCKAVQIDPCKVKEKCKRGWKTNWGCILYLESLSTSYIKLKIEMLKDTIVLYTVSPGVCGIIQIRLSKEVHSTVCTLFFSHERIINAHGPMHHLFHAHLKYHSHSVQNLNFLGKALVERNKQSSGLWQCSSCRRYEHKKLPVLTNSGFLNKHYTSTESIITSDLFLFELHLIVSVVSSWVDVLIDNSSPTHEAESEPSNNSTPIQSMPKDFNFFLCTIGAYFMFPKCITLLFRANNYVKELAQKHRVEFEGISTNERGGRTPLTWDQLIELRKNPAKGYSRKDIFGYRQWLSWGIEEHIDLVKGYEAASMFSSFVFFLSCTEGKENDSCTAKLHQQLRVYVKNTRYKNYRHIVDSVPRDCILTHIQHKDALQCSSFNNTIHYHFKEILMSRKVSWKSATNMCGILENHLPTFHSREELDELLALIKLSEYFPVAEAFYLGLTFSHFLQVIF